MNLCRVIVVSKTQYGSCTLPVWHTRKVPRSVTVIFLFCCFSYSSISWPACSPAAGSERAPLQPTSPGLQRRGWGDGGGGRRGGRAHGGQRWAERPRPPAGRQLHHHHHQPPGFCQRAGKEAARGHLLPQYIHLLSVLRILFLSSSDEWSYLPQDVIHVSLFTLGPYCTQTLHVAYEVTIPRAGAEGLLRRVNRCKTLYIVITAKLENKYTIMTLINSCYLLLHIAISHGRIMRRWALWLKPLDPLYIGAKQLFFDLCGSL